MKIKDSDLKLKDGCQKQCVQEMLCEILTADNNDLDKCRKIRKQVGGRWSFRKILWKSNNRKNKNRNFFLFMHFTFCDSPNLFLGSLLRIQFPTVIDYAFFAMFMVRYIIYRYDETIRLCLDGESKHFCLFWFFLFSQFIFTFRVDYENIKNDEKSWAWCFPFLCSFDFHNLQITNSRRQADVVLVCGS